MPELKGNKKVKRLFGPTGLEVLINILLVLVNKDRVVNSLPELSESDFLDQVTADVDAIDNPT